MKKILPILLLVILSITTIFAQITSTSNGTSVTDDTFGVTVIGIATPNTSGLSNNTYSDFNISSNGVILNNAASARTSRISGGEVNANANITAGNEASLIVNQVTNSANATSLTGTLELIGTNAVVIIANPNGITCNGCSFINVNRIELIGGTRQSDGSFSLLDDTTINVTGRGLDASGSELNLVSSFHQIDAPILAETNGRSTTLRILSGDDSYDPNSFAITSQTGSSIGGTDNYSLNISSGANIEAAAIDVVVSRLGFRNCGSTIETGNELNVTVVGVEDDLRRNQFYICDNAEIKANSFNAVAGSFQNLESSVIDVKNDFNLVTENVRGDTVSGYFDNYGVINANNFNLTVGGTFYNSIHGLIDVNNHFAVTAAENFVNNATINADIISIAAKSFLNNGGTINLDDRFSLSVAGDFDYEADFRSNGTITFVNDQSFNVGGNFFNSSNTDILLTDDTDILLTSNLEITANTFINNNNTTISAANLSIITEGDLINDNGTLRGNIVDINAGSYVENRNNATIEADNLTIVVGNYLANKNSIITGSNVDIEAASYVENSNNADIEATNYLSIVLGNYLANNNSTLEGSTVDIEAASYVDNRNNANIEATNHLSIITGEDFINAAGVDGTITANTFALSVAGNFSKYGNINVNAGLNLQVGGNFNYNDSAGDLVWKANDIITVVGDFSITANSFVNSGTINTDIFTIKTIQDFDTAFNNSGLINAATFNFSNQLGHFNYGDHYQNSGTITAADQNFNISGEFNNNTSTASDIIVTGNLEITAYVFNNGNGATIRANNLTIETIGTTGGDFSNTGTNTTIEAANDLTIIAAGDFSNSTNSTIEAANLSIEAKGFSNNTNSTIEATDLSIVTSVGDLSNTAGATLEANNIYLEGVDIVVNSDTASIEAANDLSIVSKQFGNYSNATIEVTNNLNIIATTTFENMSSSTNKGTINTKTFTLSVAGDFDYGTDYKNNGNITAAHQNFIIDGAFNNNTDITLTNGDLGITADTFSNNSDSDIKATDLSIIVNNTFFNTNSSTITGNSIYIDAGGYVSNIANSEIKANDLTIITAGNLFNVANDANATDDDKGGKIDVSTNLTIEAAGFSNVSNHGIEGEIDAGTLNLSLAGNINYANDFVNHGTISANNQFFTARNGNFTNTTNIDSTGKNFGVTANNFINTGASITANTISLSIAGNFNYQNHYLSNGTITANNLNFTARNGNFINNTTLTTGNLGITANNFNNAGGTINASKITLSVAGDFDYAADYLNNGTINNLSNVNLDLTVGGNFSYDDSAVSFVWNQQDALVVSGNASFNVNSFTKSGLIFVEGDFTVTAATFFSNNAGSITANNFNATGGNFFINAGIDVANDFNLTANSFINAGVLDVANDFNVTAATDFINSGRIDVAKDFTLTTNYFSNENTGRIGVINDFNATVTNNFLNTNIIDVANNFNATAIDFANNSQIYVDNDFNATVTNRFENGSTIEVANDFNATAIDFLNYNQIYVDNDFNATVTNNFENYGSINVGNNFNVTASNSLRNTGDAAINAANLIFETAQLDNASGNIFVDTLNLSILNGNGDEFDYDADFLNNGNIATNQFNLQVEGDFNYEGNASGDFIWDEGNSLRVGGTASIAVNNFSSYGEIYSSVFDVTVEGDFIFDNAAADFSLNGGSLVVSGNLFITANDFNNSATIDIANDFNATVRDFINHGPINVANDLNATASNALQNTGAIITDNLTIEASQFNNINGNNIGTISVDTLDLTLSSGGFDYEEDYLNNGTISTNNLKIEVGGEFTNLANIEIAGDLVIISNTFKNNGVIDVANNFNVAAGGGSFFNNSGNSRISANTLTISTNYRFFNEDGRINVDLLSLSLGSSVNNYEFDYVADYLNNGTIETNSLNLQVAGDFRYDVTNDFVWNAQDSLLVKGDAFITTGIFTNNGIIDIENEFEIIASVYFDNNARINTNILTIEADSFLNEAGSLNFVDLFNLSVGGDFNHQNDYLNNGNISANRHDFEIGGDFSFNDLNDDFIWSLEDSLVALGSIFVTADNFTNYGSIVTDGLNAFLSGNLLYDDEINDFIVNNYLIVQGDAYVTTDRFTNHGAISIANDFAVHTVGVIDQYTNGAFDNNATINAANLTITTDSFSNDRGIIDIANNFSVTATNSFENWSRINVGGNLNVTTDEFISYRAIRVVNDFNITATNEFTNNETITASGDLTVYTTNFNQDRGVIDIANNFNITATNRFTNNTTIHADAIDIFTDFFFNEDGNIFIDAFSISLPGDFNYENDYLSGNVSGANSLGFILRDGGNFTTNTDIILTGDFEIESDGFDNTNNATISADNLRFVLGDYLDNNDGSIIKGNNIYIEAERYVYNRLNSTIDALDNLSIIVNSGDFINNTDSTLKGNNVSIEAKTFAQNTNASTIEAADSFSIIIEEGGFNNRTDSTIKASNAIDIVAGDIVYNTIAATIEADNVSIEAGSFVENTEGSTIDTDSLTIVASYFNNIGSSSNPEGNVIADSFALSVASGRDGVGVDFSYTDDFANNGNISGLNSQYFTVRNGSFTNTTNFFLTGDFEVTANSFINSDNITIEADNISIVVLEGDLYNNGAILRANNSIYLKSIFASDPSKTAVLRNFSSSIIEADSLTIETGEFSNALSTINVDTFTLSVARGQSHTKEFQYGFDYLDNGTITANNQYFTVRDYGFSNPSNNIVLTGDLGITAESVSVSPNSIISANTLSIVASDFLTNDDNSTIIGNNVSIEVGNYVSNIKNSTIEAADDLTIVAGNYISNAENSTIEAADDLTIVAIGNADSYLSNQSNSIIKGNNISIEVTDYLLNTANSTIEAAANLTINTREFYNVAAGAKLINNVIGGTINAANLTIETDTFSNINNDGDIDGNINITANTFTLSVADDFDYRDDYLNNGNISHVNNQYLTVREGDFINNADIVLTGDLEITAEKIIVSSNNIISADNLTIVASNFLNNNNDATIKGNNVSIEAVSYILNSANATVEAADNLTIDTSVFFNVAAGASDTGGNIIATNLTIETDIFYNINAAGIAGNITAYTFSLSVAGDFDYEEDYLNNGNIIANNQYLTARDGDFTNSTDIEFTGNFGVTANNFSNTDATIDVNTFSLSVAGDFDYEDDLLDGGNIIANNQYFTVRDGDFTNNTDILLTGDFGVTANNFSNIDGTTDGTINVNTFILSVAGDLSYADDFLNNGNITATNQNFTARDGVFIYNSDIILTGDLGITANNLNNNVGFILKGNNIDIQAIDFVHNTNSSTIEADNNVNIIVENGNFTNNNSSILKGNNVSIEAGTYAQNTNTSTIEAAGYFSINVEGGGFNNNTGSTIIGSSGVDIAAVNFVYNVNASTIESDGNVSIIVENGNFINNIDSALKGGIISIDAKTYAQNTNASTIEADNVSIIAGNSYFVNNNSSTIRGNSTIEIEAASYVQNTNASTIRTNSLAIVTGSFNNISSNPSATNPAGNVITNIFALSVAGDFNYTDDYLNNGNISHANAQYFTTRNGDFTNTTNIRLTGNFEVTADSFTNIDNASIEANNLKFILGDYLTNNEGSTLEGNSIVIETENYVHNLNASTIESDGNVSIIVEDGNFINNISSALKGDIISIDARTYAQNTNTSTITATDSLTIEAYSFNNNTGSTIKANNAVDIVAESLVQNTNSSTIEADNLSIIAGNSYFINNNSSTIRGNSTIDIEAEDFVQNTNASTIETDSLTIEAFTWNNISSNPSADSPAGNIIADSFTLSVERGRDDETGLFDYYSDYLNNGNVSHASTQYFTIRNGQFQINNTIDLTGNFGVTADSFSSFNNIDIIAANLSLVAATGNIIITGNNFRGDSIYIKTTGSIINDSVSIVADNLTIEANSLQNDGSTNITTNTFNLSVANGQFDGDFDYQADYINNGNISADNQYITVREKGFSSTVNIERTGNFGVTADSFSIFDSIDIIAANLSLVAATGNIIITNSNFRGDSIYIKTASGAPYVLNDNATIEADNLTIETTLFSNSSSTISTDTFNLSVANGLFGEAFDYQTDYINNGNISANNQYITVREKGFSSTVNIELVGNFGVTADSFSSFNNIDISAANLSLVAATGNIISQTSNFRGDSVYIKTTGGIINNSVSIVADNLTIEAYNLQNDGSTNITTNTFNLSVADGLFGDFDYQTDYINNGNISADNQYITVRENVFNNSTNIEFAGNLGITAENFTNDGTINVASFAARVSGTFQNEANAEINAIRTGLFVNDFNNFGDIDSTDLFFAEASQNFTNSGNLNSNLFIVAAYDFSNEISGDISSNVSSITSNSFYNGSESSIQSANLFIKTTGIYNEDRSNNVDFNNAGTINSRALIVIAENDFNNHQEIIANSAMIQADNFYNYSNGTFENNHILDISADTFSNEGDINAYAIRIITNSYDNTGDVNFQYLFR